ncbi:DUF2442 domain-containing protein [soil metagenome]
MLLDASPGGQGTVHVQFADGLSADVDLSYLAGYGGVFEPLNEQGFFDRLRPEPEAGTIVWPNGADIAPETLYEHARKAAQDSAG